MLNLSNRILFAGPTLYSLPDPLAHVPPDLRLRRPVRRGDVWAAARRYEPGILVIVDGRFHQALAVGHREIREAIELGWIVWGLSSMGAIRAREMRDLGMKGYGQVYDRFWAEDDFQDDEVALLHELKAPYRAASEPMAHLRAAAEYLRVHEFISIADHDRIVDALKSLWYGDRTLPLFHRMVLDAVPPAVHPQVRAELAAFDRFRLKSLDLKAFLASGIWRGDGFAPITTAPS